MENDNDVTSIEDLVSANDFDEQEVNLDVYRKEAEEGSTLAQYKLGICYQKGVGTQIDHKQAFKWFAMAAASGYPGAQYSLGYCYKHGEGTPVNHQKALEAYTKAAESGNADAKFGIALYYTHGRAVPVDLEKALEWYIKAAESGSTSAQCGLAHCYRQGLGTHIDHEKAFEWYTKAAENGYHLAQTWVRIYHKLKLVDRPMEHRQSFSSGNKTIDKFIQSTPYVYWIPYENCKNITFIARGGFASIYKATLTLNNKRKQVALKCLDNSTNISSSFMAEVQQHMQVASSVILHIYGITKQPKTNLFMMVMQWCEHGDLGKNLDSLQTFGDIYRIIRWIATGLSELHRAGLCHRDLHTGNILLNRGKERAIISDLGLCGPAYEKVTNDEYGAGSIVGVLPYIAPEVLQGGEYTTAADIYSFGVIMWVLLARQQPYMNRGYNTLLCIDILKGLHPKIPDWTPAWLQELINHCWYTDISMRPTAQEIVTLLKDVTGMYMEKLPSVSVLPPVNIESVAFSPTSKY